jgi:hypothetical protein
VLLREYWLDEEMLSGVGGMKIGDIVRIIPELVHFPEDRDDGDSYKILWDDPPDFTSIYRKNHVGKFHYTEVGMVLEQKYVSDGNLPLHVQTTWIKVLCSSGNIGWIKRCDLELVR